jgi:TctA family transporter
VLILHLVALGVGYLQDKAKQLDAAPRVRSLVLGPFVDQALREDRTH